MAAAMTIVCPVCEHQQAAGSECEQCGRHLVEGRGTDAPVAPLDGLEPTALDASAAAWVGAEAPLLDLETTRFEPAGAAVEALIPDLVPTRADPVQVLVEETPDLERIAAAIPDGESPGLAASAVCRYCHTPVQPGDVYCGHCAMRLPRASPAAGPAPLAEPICGCGAPVTRAICPACGARHVVA
jgi:hypothetical protein